MTKCNKNPEGKLGINSSKVYCKSFKAVFTTLIFAGINSSKVYCK